MDECLGWGRTFGHKFQPRYSVVDAPPKIPEKVEGGLALSSLAGIIEAATRRERIYECDVCVRCGKIVQRPEVKPECKVSEAKGVQGAVKLTS
jgi:hypothetical protein